MIINKKDSVLKKIREALTQPTPIPFPKSEGQTSVFTTLSQDIDIEFAERFTELQGKFAFCIHHKDLINQFNTLVAAQKWENVYCIEPRISTILGLEQQEQNAAALAGCDASVTGCEFLVARTGSIVLSAAQQSGRNASVYAPIHICIAFTSQLVYDVKDALEGVKQKYGTQIPSLITFATGPSRTADIEKTLVVGVHGPKEVYVFLVDDDNKT